METFEKHLEIALAAPIPKRLYGIARRYLGLLRPGQVPPAVKNMNYSEFLMRTWIYAAQTGNTEAAQDIVDRVLGKAGKTLMTAERNPSPED